MDIADRGNKDWEEVGTERNISLRKGQLSRDLTSGGRGRERSSWQLNNSESLLATGFRSVF